MKWKIYYGDGNTYDSQSGFVDKAPARDVQVIILEDKDVGWITQAKTDYYIWNKNRWWGVDHFGLYDYLIEPGYKRVLFGRTLSQDEFQAIFKRASDDMQFERKTAFANRERRP